MDCHILSYLIVWCESGIEGRETTSACSATFMATHTRTYASIRSVNTLALGQWLAAVAI